MELDRNCTNPTQQGILLSPEGLRAEWNKLLRHILSAISSLRHWGDDADADLYCDPSGHGLGLVIIQNQMIVALASRKLTDREHEFVMRRSTNIVSDSIA